MRIGLLGGSFNPPHVGHLFIAQQILEYKNLKFDEVLFMPNLTSETYSKKKLANKIDRYKMCIHAISDFKSEKMKVSEIEMNYEYKYTYQTLEHLAKEYPNDKFYLIIGSDQDIFKFKNWQDILSKTKVIQIERPNYELNKADTVQAVKFKNFIFYLDQKLAFNISSTEIRNRIKKGLKITNLVTPSVEKYIYEKGLYK